MGHWLKQLVIVIDGWLCIYFSDVGEKVNGGPYGVGGNASILQVLNPLGHDKIPIFVGDMGIWGTKLIICLKPIGRCVHIVGGLELP